MIYIIAIYVSLSPIYWLPGISFNYLATIKLAMIAALLLFRGFKASSPLSAEIYQLIIALTVASLCTAVAILSTSNITVAIERARDFIEPLLWIIIISGISRRDIPLLYRSLLVTLTAFSLITIYPLAAGLKLIPDSYVPENVVLLLGDRFSYLVNRLVISDAGFNTGHSGWGPPVAMATLLLRALLVSSDMRHGRLLSRIVLFTGLAATFVCTARGAFFMLVLSIVLWKLITPRSRSFALIAVISGFVLYATIDVSGFLPERFVQPISGNDLGSRLDSLSTGRISTYLKAAENFILSPLVGVGVEAARVELRGGTEILQVHNIWLRMAAEGGLLMLVPALWVGSLIVRNFRGLAKRRFGGRNHLPENAVDLRPVLTCGLLISLIEPGMIFGSFNNNVVFWTAVVLMMRQNAWQTKPVNARKLSTRPSNPEVRLARIS